MKSILNKGVFFLLSVVGLMAITSVVQADWQCKVHNARGQMWFGQGETRAKASAHAMRRCVKNSKFARNCVIDFCKPTHGGFVPPMGGMWQCNVTNAKGQQFIGTGMTRSHAAEKASRICAANSRHARNCVVQACFKQR